MRPKLNKGALPKVFHGFAVGIEEQISGIHDLYVLTLLDNVRDNKPGLGQVWAARRVADDPTRFRCLDRRDEQRPLEDSELGEVIGGATPPGFRPPTQGAEPGAGRVDQDAVIGLWLVLADLAAVTGADHDLEAG